MFNFLHSIFGSDDTTGNYPDSLVKAAIERAVDGTDPWIRAVSGYKKKLRPAVIRAIDHVVALVDGIAPPIEVEFGGDNIDPRLHTFFISSADMRKIFAADRTLADFKRKQAVALPRVVALLAMEKRENIILGAELSGDVVQHGVPQVTVSFETHHLFDPMPSEAETRRHLKRRAFDHLLALALRRITIVKEEREELEGYRALLQSKLNLLKRGNWGFDKTDGDEHLDAAGIEEKLGRIEAQLLEFGGDDRMLDVYLGIVTDVLSRPGQHLWASRETLIIDHMGIKRSRDNSDAPEVTLDLISNDEGLNLVVQLVAIIGDI